MIKFEKTDIMNMENAIRGARNPMNSWLNSDSYYNKDFSYVIGKNDMNLMQKLIVAGNDHRKFMRQIFVSVDITAPIYWWKEYDTYKVATVANSQSTMHKIHSKPFEINDFSVDRMTVDTLLFMTLVVKELENTRLAYINTKKKRYWDSMIQLLPSSYNQMRTCTMNYENLFNMYYSRRNHKLLEWREFCIWIESLPYAKELILLDNITLEK